MGKKNGVMNNGTWSLMRRGRFFIRLFEIAGLEAGS